ncbi:MAG: PQQ-binding-like beta-propeller repeat protein [Panacagrimonas sp.]|nr:PQQ-binding-like beta-propeller repeat protein [Panacagrimonas sp.]MCC2659095.1 PQQ-binding-like beta-propeller repeat protein [Panacagrimonas sp.]
MWVFRRPILSVGLLAISSMLTACGGGGGGGSSSAIDVHVTTRSISGQVLQGDTTMLQAYATVTVDENFSGGAIYVIVNDRGATPVLQTAQLLQDVDGYRVDVLTRGDLPPGRYASTFQVSVCNNPGCSTVYARESVSYVLQVDSATHLTALTPLEGAGDWTERSGSFGRSNYVGVTLDPADFNARWRTRIPDFYSGMHNPFMLPVDPALTADDAIFFPTTQGSDNGSRTMMALNESDGSVRWSFNGSVLDREPLIANGVLYSKANEQYQTAIAGFDLATGGLVALIPTGNISDATLTHADGRLVYAGSVPDPSGNRLVGLNLGTQTVEWHHPFTTPVTSFGADGDTLVSYVAAYSTVSYEHGTINYPAKLNFLRASDGATTGSIEEPSFDPANYADHHAHLVPGGTGEVIGAAGTRIAFFDTVAGTLRWSLTDRYFLAAGEGVTYLMRSVYGPSGGAPDLFVDAVSNVNGATLWTWAVPEQDSQIHSFIFTRNVALMATAGRTIALDLATRQVVWSYPRSGALSMSRNGVLYLMRSQTQSSLQADGEVIAFNLH